MVKVIRATAEWCGPCKMYAPVFDNVAKKEEFSDVTFEVFDVDSDNELALKYGIRSIPTTIIEVDGEVVDRKMGAMPEAALSNIISSHL